MAGVIFVVRIYDFTTQKDGVHTLVAATQKHGEHTLVAAVNKDEDGTFDDVTINIKDCPF